VSRISVGRVTDFRLFDGQIRSLRPAGRRDRVV